MRRPSLRIEKKCQHLNAHLSTRDLEKLIFLRNFEKKDATIFKHTSLGLECSAPKKIESFNENVLHYVGLGR